MATANVTLADVVRKELGKIDFLQEAVWRLVRELMAGQVTAQIGVKRYESNEAAQPAAATALMRQAAVASTPLDETQLG